MTISNLEKSKKRIYIPTEELYSSRTSKTGSGVVPAFNNIYDVWIDFHSARPYRGQTSLQRFINQHGFYEKNMFENPGDYLALFCSEAVLPGAQIQTSQVAGLRQGVVSNYALYRRYPDVTLTFYSQKDYYTNEVFSAWMEYISPTRLSNDTFGTSTSERKNDVAAYKKMRYPEEYKCNIEITAFSNDIFSEQSRLTAKTDTSTSASQSRLSNSITYSLVRAFPTNIVAAPLAYGSAELIKTSVTFTYDYYYTDRTSRNYDNDIVLRSDTGNNVRNPF